MRKIKAVLIIFLLIGFNKTEAQESKNKILAEWRFEQVQHFDRTLSASIIDKSLTVDEKNKPAEPQPFFFDSSGNGNFLQVRSTQLKSSVFSNNVLEVTGKPNTRSLALKSGEYMVSFERPLSFNDLQKSWTIEASLMCNLLGTEQVFLCKEGAKGQLAGDVSIGYDNMLKQYFVEVMCADGIARRIGAGDDVKAGVWYDVRAQANYDIKSRKTTLVIEVKNATEKKFSKSASIIFEGTALKREAGMWIIGRGYPGGFPNSLSVLDGAIDEIRISGEALPRAKGQNPLFTDSFTADPTALVVGNTVYVYVGRDAASVGGWFNMPDWLCYSTTDMKNWTSHGPVLAAKDFETANSNSAWAAQVVEKDGKYYFYVTLDREDGHFITVAVGDSPTGPFKEALPGKPLVIDSMTKDSHRANSDIDPTVFIDDDGTPWLAWGNGDCYMVRLKNNMIETEGPITKVPFRNFSEGPWLFKRGKLYYNIYAADAPGVQAEQICYSTAEKITGPWTYRGFLTGAAKHGFTIHPAVIEFKNQWYFFYHDGSNTINGEPGGDTRRTVCAEYLYFNPDGTIKPIKLTSEGISIPPK